MTRGSIWVRECTTAPTKENESLEEGVLAVGNEEKMTLASGPIRLRRGEIAVIGCVSSPILPLINLNQRTPDINLSPGQFATIRCRNSFGRIIDETDVICDRRVTRVATRDLFLGQFVVVTYDRPLPLTGGANESVEIQVEIDDEEAEEVEIDVETHEEADSQPE